jgi:hypothetical protein
MVNASALPSRYRIGKTSFYQRRNYLTELGYDLEPVKQGRKSFYSDEQVQLLDELDSYIKTHGDMEGFAPPQTSVDKYSPVNDGKAATVNGNGKLVHHHSEQVEIESAEDEEILVETNPLEDIKEQQYQSVHVAAQYNAAQNLAAFNYLTLDYMKHRDFTVDGLAEQVHKSEQAVRESFASMMESPEQATKKLLAKIRQRRNRT